MCTLGQADKWKHAREIRGRANTTTAAERPAAAPWQPASPVAPPTRTRAEMVQAAAPQGLRAAIAHRATRTAESRWLMGPARAGAGAVAVRGGSGRLSRLGTAAAAAMRARRRRRRCGQAPRHRTTCSRDPATRKKKTKRKKKKERKKERKKKSKKRHGRDGGGGGEVQGPPWPGARAIPGTRWRRGTRCDVFRALGAGFPGGPGATGG